VAQQVLFSVGALHLRKAAIHGWSRALYSVHATRSGELQIHQSVFTYPTLCTLASCVEKSEEMEAAIEEVDVRVRQPSGEVAKLPTPEVYKGTPAARAA
jgi:hypothetical protein